MVNVGNVRVSEMYLGISGIWRAHLGESLVFYRGLYPAEDLLPGDTLVPEDDPE